MTPKFLNRRIVWSSPWVIALIPLVITLFFVNDLFQKYNLKLITIEQTGRNIKYYEDLDIDGNSENIYFYYYLNQPQVIIRNFDEEIEEVYNIPGEYFDGRNKVPKFCAFDVTGDNLKEIFIFSINSNDSLFISRVNHYSEANPVQNKFITQLPKFRDNLDFIIEFLGAEDNNGDKSAELLFFISAGFSLQPRAVFAWDIKNDSIYRSPLMGINIKSIASQFYLEDINHDNIKEIFLRTVSTDNYKDSIPYSDKYSWLMVFTKDLEFLFEPKLISSDYIEINHFPYQNDSVDFGTFIYDAKEGKNYPDFVFYSSNGIEVNRINVDGSNNQKWMYLQYRNNRIYLERRLLNVFEMCYLNDDFSINKNNFKLMNNSEYPVFKDIDNDGTLEIIAYSEIGKKLYVLRKDLKNIVSVDIDPTKLDISTLISVGFRNSIPENILYCKNGSSFYLKYGKNKWYYLNPVIVILYYLFLVFSFNQLRKVWLSNLLRIQETEKEMQQLQMKTVMNQLNPHFTFNAINTVGAAILEKNTQKAYESLTRLSRLFRRVVDHAYQPHKSLGDELDFVHDYLEVEKSRFGEKLSYTIKIDQDIDLKLKIPKMLIQLFVENAIKHGIFHSKNVGHIEISVKRQKQNIEIIITDNGVGRKKTFKINDGKVGNGMIILENYLRLFKEHYNRIITFNVTDLYHDREDCGTKVVINIVI